MELGTSTCLFAHRRKQSVTPPYIEQVRMCVDAGFKVIDMNFCSAPAKNSGADLAADDWEKRIYDLKNEGEKLGVKFTQSHAPFNAKIFTKGLQPTPEYMEVFNEMTRRSIIASGMLGIKWMVFHALNDTINTEYDMEVTKQTNLEYFSWQLELCKKHGVGMAIENMFNVDPKVYKRYYCASLDDQINLIDAFKDESVGACWDFGHSSQILNDQCRALRRLGKRLKATHVQDNKGNCDAHLIPFVGGNIKWEEIMPCLKEIGYEGDFVYEVHNFMNYMPDALRPSAAKLAYDFGMYCMKLYDEA